MYCIYKYAVKILSNIRASAPKFPLTHTLAISFSPNAIYILHQTPSILSASFSSRDTNLPSYSTVVQELLALFELRNLSLSMYCYQGCQMSSTERC